MKSNRYILWAKQNIAKLFGSLSRIFGKTVSVRIFGKKRTIRPLAITGIIVAAALLLSLLGSVISTSIGTRFVDVSFEAGSPYSVITDGKDAILYNNRGATGINSRGRQNFRIDAPMSEPTAEVAGDFLLLADLAGNHYAASYKNGKLFREYTLGSDIITAKITEDGCAAIATDTDGYKGKVTVFNKRGRELYVWNSGSGYITDVAITNGGRFLAVAQLISDGTDAATRIQFIDTRRGEVVGTADYTGTVAVNLKFINQSKLLVISDNHILGLNRHGRELFSVSLEGRSPSLYDIGDKMIAVAAVDSRGNRTIEMYSMSGKQLGVYTAGGDIRALSVHGRSVIAAQQKGVVRVNRRGKEKSILPTGHDIKSIGYFADDRAVIIGTAQAETVKIK